jgi:hypothetical protein
MYIVTCSNQREQRQELNSAIKICTAIVIVLKFCDFFPSAFKNNEEAV